jgi:hypothetical protein
MINQRGGGRVLQCGRDVLQLGDCQCDSGRSTVYGTFGVLNTIEIIAGWGAVEFVLDIVLAS